MRSNPTLAGSESVQCDIGPFPVAGPAYTRAVGGGLTVVCMSNILLRRKYSLRFWDRSKLLGAPRPQLF